MDSIIDKMTSNAYKVLKYMYSCQIKLPDGTKYIPLSQAEMVPLIGVSTININKIFKHKKQCEKDIKPSVEEAYVDFEDKERNEEIEAFAKEKNIDADKIKQIISEYEFSHTLTNDMIKEQIPMALPFRERRALIQAIIDFITQNCDK